MTEPELRILVTGARHCTRDQATVVAASLSEVMSALIVSTLIVVHGQCPQGGVDLAAHLWTLDHPDVIAEPHPADWERHGKAAGPIRNTAMVKLGAFMCLAFPSRSSVGTWDCIRKAVNAGIPTHVYPLEGPR